MPPGWKARLAELQALAEFFSPDDGPTAAGYAAALALVVLAGLLALFADRERES